MFDIKIYKPKTLDDALEIKANLLNDIAVLAGGTDLTIRLKEKTIIPKGILDISGLEDLKFVLEDNAILNIGPLCTHNELSDRHTDWGALIDSYAPELGEGCRVLGSPQIRNIATIGGNIVNSSPVGDTIPPLFVLGARLKVQSLKGERYVDIADFATAPGKNVLKPTELLTGIVFEKHRKKDRGFFNKIGQRRALFIAKSSVAFKGSWNGDIFSGVKIALGAVAPTVIFAPETAAFLNDNKLTRDTLDQACNIIRTEGRPINDLRSTVQYRRVVLGALLKKGLLPFLGKK
ncbi:FAD binding domain-containing protein [bacterium]|nr:FAD binding domain-containing protein [bacterium]